MTTVVHMQYTWITEPVSELSVVAASPTRSGTASRPGDFLLGASGRIRVVTSAGDTQVFPVKMQSLSDSDLLLLQSWRGMSLLLRDGMGWRVWGSFLDVQWNDTPGGEGMIHDATLTFESIAYDEAV